MAHLDVKRVQFLTRHLLSSQVRRPQVAADAGSASARLRDAEVEKVFLDNVPGVDKFLFRGKAGVYSLRFLVSAYKEGLRAFRDTPVHEHLISMMRQVVHCGHARGAEVAKDLREVAEAFTECQAVQARTIEKVGLRLSGQTLDFRGLVMQLLSEYKLLAVKMLAYERLAQGLAQDYDPVPTHYENRLIADLGDDLGLDAANVRLARLDTHASQRFPKVTKGDATAAVARCRELFDMTAFLQALVAEVNSFHEDSPKDSLAACFLEWVDETLSRKHVVLDEESCTRTDISCAFAMSLVEYLFLGAPQASRSELFRGVPLVGLFSTDHGDAPSSVQDGSPNADTPLGNASAMPESPNMDHSDRAGGVRMEQPLERMRRRCPESNAVARGGSPLRAGEDEIGHLDGNRIRNVRAELDVTNLRDRRCTEPSVVEVAQDTGVSQGRWGWLVSCIVMSFVRAQRALWYGLKSLRVCPRAPVTLATLPEATCEASSNAQAESNAIVDPASRILISNAD